MKRKIIILISALVAALMLIVPSLTLYANAVEILFDGVTFYDDDRLLINGMTYVPLRNCLQTKFKYDVSWDPKIRTAFITTDSLEISCREGETYIVANGRCLSNGGANIILNGRMYIPLRSLAKALGGEVEWNGAAKSASVTLKHGFVAPASEFYNKDDLYWLSRIINAESDAEPFNGKIAVGNVVLNRVRSAEFPNNIKDVIFDDKFGVQFTPVSNGSIYNEPNAESVIAAMICLDGYSLTSTSLYFINDALATNHWVSDNCAYVMSIGSHDFYA